MLEQVCEAGASLYDRGYAFGSTGNLSVREGNRVWITPTGVPLKGLTPERLACIDLEGNCLNENKPSKEYPFHLAAYRAAGERARAIVHLHSTHTVALSCLAVLDPDEPIRPFTPYYLMRVAPLAVLPYFRPGSKDLAAAIQDAAVEHDCMLLRNHGSVCLGGTFSEALDRAEELEETAKLFFLLGGSQVRYLAPAEQMEIQLVFRS
jgi:ribulose-5-phosphate 4-epimerase/fuculose-1-phosphate aldolase